MEVRVCNKFKDIQVRWNLHFSGILRSTEW